MIAFRYVIAKLRCHVFKCYDKTFSARRSSYGKKLILAGLAEHWGELDLSKNPDLDDITSTYASGAFFVAWLKAKLSELVRSFLIQLGLHKL